MAFEITPNVRVSRDQQGQVTHLSHVQEPYRSPALARPTAVQLAAEYAGDVMPIYGLPDLPVRATESAEAALDPEVGAEVRFEEDKRLRGSTTVSLRQTYMAVPIWDAVLQIHLTDDDPRVTSSACTLHHDLEFDDDLGVDTPTVAAPVFVARVAAETHAEEGAPSPEGEHIDAALMNEALGVKARRKPAMEVTRRRLMWYRYDPDARTEGRVVGDEDERVALTGDVPTLPLPPVDDAVTPGVHHLCWEVMFTRSVPGHEGLHWRAMVEVRTGSVLYLRALTASATACVYLTDPPTQSGATVDCSDSNATLNAHRTNVTLEGTKPPDSGNQALSGDLVEVSDTDAPTDAPPTASSPYAFCFDVKTQDFGAANAYHHSDHVFRLVEDMGFVLADYFDGTTFPVPVDHAGMSTVNAQAPGNSTGTGLDRFRFGLACASGEISMAASQRVTLHEFGHALLWDHVGSPNFGFAHSAGDALAAILNDPGTQAGDRYSTFPWITAMNPTIDRRHDRDPSAGWSWGGTNHNSGYGGEQVLSTTLFRLYESLGGARTGHLPTQEWASRFTAFLIIKAIGTLTATTTDPSVYATALMNADLTELDFEGQVGGAVHKVIRWSFEQQGLYQPSGGPTPTTGPGAPPDVDVFIDDGRAGEYDYLRNFWSSQDMWNRLSADGGSTHETPVTGQTNHLYVRVGNRGTQTASGVTVRAFHCEPGTGLAWPDDWAPMTTVQLTAPDIPAGGSVVVGPFEWTPEVVGHECLLALADATGDPANDTTVNGAVAHSRFVPFDNNIGQRNVAPVPGGGGWRALVEALRHRRFRVRNPYPWPLRITLQAELPELLRRRGWALTWEHAGTGSFTLAARESRLAQFSLQAGEDFTAEEAKVAQGEIVVVALGDDRVEGGMTYRIDPEMIRPPREVAEVSDAPGRDEDCSDPCTDAGRELLECLDLPTKGLSGARLRTVTVDLTFGDC